MGYNQDWLLNQIEAIGRFVAKLVFKKDTIVYEINDHDNYSQTDLLYKEIQLLIKQDEICKSENLLFENLDENNIDYLKLALDFYQTISKLNDEKLEKCNFSREEIAEGLHDILEIYKIPFFDQTLM